MDNNETINEISNNIETDCIQTIHSLYEKYADNPYMLSKTKNLICNQLPNILANILKTHEDRQIRFEKMTIEQDGFIQSFFNNNQYFYIASTDKFFFYDGQHYQLFNEDDILYHILSSISRGRQLMSWKQKTKLNIMKRIRDNNSLLKSVPEPTTIQFVINQLYPALFASKAEAKYFLTILGDNIWKKNANLVHFICPGAKQFIRYLNELSHQHLGTNLYNTFKHKYYEHEYANCRLVLINESVKQESLWKPIVTNSILDILCVSSHYSTRYQSSDDYITNYSNEPKLIEQAFYLKDRSHADLVRDFIAKYLQLPSSSSANTSSIGQKISWKNMQYLWKHFLDSLNLPTIMFQQTLKSVLIEQLSAYYNAEEDAFKGVFSKYLPIIQKFLQFWEENIVIDETETDFEIDELSALFKKSCDRADILMNNRQIIDIIGYYYPTIEIDQEKFIHHIRCNLWDKQMDIQMALDNMQFQLRNRLTRPSIENISSPYPSPGSSPNNTVTILAENGEVSALNQSLTIYDMYVNYCKFYSNIDNKRLIVSKPYFEKYVLENMAEYVIDSMMVSHNWLIE